jgi:hypothetical protein
MRDLADDHSVPPCNDVICPPSQPSSRNKRKRLAKPNTQKAVESSGQAEGCAFESHSPLPQSQQEHQSPSVQQISGSSDFVAGSVSGRHSPLLQRGPEPATSNNDSTTDVIVQPKAQRIVKLGGRNEEWDSKRRSRLPQRQHEHGVNVTIDQSTTRPFFLPSSRLNRGFEPQPSDPYPYQLSGSRARSGEISGPYAQWCSHACGSNMSKNYNANNALAYRQEVPRPESQFVIIAWPVLLQTEVR